MMRSPSPPSLAPCPPGAHPSPSRPETGRSEVSTFARAGRSAVLLSALALAFGPPAGAVDWVDYIEVTGARMSADAAVGIDDTMEKDLAAGDVDRDGDVDLLVVRKVPFSNPGGKRNVLFMNENGVLTDRTSTLAADMLDETDDRDLVLVDINGDDWLDVVTATTFDEQPRVYINRGNNLAGEWRGFTLGVGRLPTFVPAPQFCAIAAGDVNGDDFPDIYLVDYDNNLEDRLLINDGNGFFTDETTTRLTQPMYESVFGTDAAIVDIDGDGDQDIVKNNSSGSNPPPGSSAPAVRVFYNDGTGNFDFLALPYTDAPYMIEVADLDLDDRPDIFVVDDGQDAVLWNRGNDPDGRAILDDVLVSSSPRTAFFGGNTQIADLDADGFLDILVADVDTDIPGCGRSLVLLRGEGTPGNVAFTDPLGGATRDFTPQGTFDIEVFDMNGDGVLDIWAGTCTGNRLFQGLGMMFSSDFESGTTGDWSSSSP